MFYVEIENGRAVRVNAEYRKGPNTECRHDWKTHQRAMDVAAQLTAVTGKTYLGVDNGPNVSPRFDVIAAPALHAPVSRYFNGDSYPAGTIVKISASFNRVQTSDGTVFFRKRLTGSWVASKTWSMTNGHHEARNPSF